jgi:hypothetical protein
MSFDGETKKEGSFESIDDAWEHANNMGSKWYFYPFSFVSKGKTVVSTPDPLMAIYENRRISTIKKEFKRVSELPECEGLDAIDYMLMVVKNS